MATVRPEEVVIRTNVLERAFALLERQYDRGTLEGAMLATAGLAVPQLVAACDYVIRTDPKGPLVASIIKAVDADSRARLRSRQEASGLDVVPYVKGADERDVQRWRAPAGRQWEPHERAIHAADLGLEVPEHLRLAMAAEVAAGSPPAELGPPPDPDGNGPVTRERRDQLHRQLLARLARIKPPPRVRGMASAAAGLRTREEAP